MAKNKTKPTKRRKTPAPPARSHEPEGRWIAAALFGLALLLRLLFLYATPDTTWPHSTLYKGDAPTWLAYADAIAKDQSFDQGLPLRPPGNAYLVAALGDDGVANIVRLKWAWCLMGALTVWGLYLAVRRSFGPGPALGVGLLAAFSHGLMVFSTSINNETPYLFLVALLLWAWPRIATNPRVIDLAGWGALNALACLFRVEHTLFFVLTFVHFAIFSWRVSESGLSRRWRIATVATIFSVVLVPWHLKAWSGIHEFNHGEPAPDPRTEAMFVQLENALAHITWDASAQAARAALPAVCRRTMGNFVTATVAVRGGQSVTLKDFEILEEAFGTIPSHLAAYPFVALYGGLNFYLANHEGAPPGFTRGPLDFPPPLDGGPQRYPGPLVAGLPPPDLALTYPPHLQMVNEGYALGLRWIVDHPATAAALVFRKLEIFWSGATLGFGGQNLPFGNSGIRRRVDLAVPTDNTLSPLWQLLWFATCGGGLWLARRNPALFAWLAYLVTKLVATTAFFGYARQGASAFLVVALLAALVLDQALQLLSKQPKLVPRALLATTLILVAAEGLRTARPPQLQIDGQNIGTQDPWPMHLHEDRQITVEKTE